MMLYKAQRAKVPHLYAVTLLLVIEKSLEVQISLLNVDDDVAYRMHTKLL